MVFRAFLASGAGLAALMAAYPAIAQGDASSPAVSPAEAAARDPDTVYIEADTFINDAENGRYIARGNVVAYAGGRIVRAAEVEYYSERDRLIATGGITIVEPDGGLEFADSADMTNGLDEAVAVNFSMRLANGAVVTAAYLERSEGTQNLLTRATYSPCPVCEEDPTPTWAIRARKALQDTEDQMIYYRDVTLHIAGVPIFYSPFFAHADPSVDRKTGPLLPRIGYSTLTGFEYEQPFFWAIDDYQDLTVTPRIMSDVTPLLGLNYRKRFWSGSVEFDATITKEQMFNSAGTRFGEDIIRGSIFGSGVFALDKDWSWGLGFERVTDRDYLVRYGIPPQRQTGLYTGFGNALISQVFITGQDENFYSSIAAGDYQSIYLGPSEDLPQLLPLAEFRHTFDLNDFGRLETVADFTFLRREAGLEYLRGTAWADWHRRHVTAPGIVVEALGRGRADVYRIENALDPATGAPKSGSASRLSGYGGLDVSWPFYRPGNITLTIEPRIQGVVSAGNHSALNGFASDFTAGQARPLLEDSLIVEINGSNLFALDKFSGFDLLEEGARLNVGATFETRWRNSLGRIFLGQSFRTRPENFTAASGLGDDASDFVAEGFLQSGPVSMTTSMRIDPDDFKVQRIEASGRFNLAMFTFEGTYLNVDQAVSGYGERESVSLISYLRLTENWTVGASVGRDLVAGYNQGRSFQLTYRDDCFSISAAYIELNYPGTSIGRSKAFTINFTLATLGVFGTDSRAFVPVY